MTVRRAKTCAHPRTSATVSERACVFLGQTGSEPEGSMLGECSALTTYRRVRSVRQPETKHETTHICATPRNQTQANTKLGQFVPEQRFLVFDFAVHMCRSDWRGPTSTEPEPISAQRPGRVRRASGVCSRQQFE
eukprot:1500622-Rhodomonas_salina.2